MITYHKCCKNPPLVTQTVECISCRTKIIVRLDDKIGSAINLPAWWESAVAYHDEHKEAKS